MVLCHKASPAIPFGDTINALMVHSQELVEGELALMASNWWL